MMGGASGQPTACTWEGCGLSGSCGPDFCRFCSVDGERWPAGRAGPHTEAAGWEPVSHQAPSSQPGPLSPGL